MHGPCVQTLFWIAEPNEMLHGSCNLRLLQPLDVAVCDFTCKIWVLRVRLLHATISEFSSQVRKRRKELVHAKCGRLGSNDSCHFFDQLYLVRCNFGEQGVVSYVRIK